jgi:hypothetical protein
MPGSGRRTPRGARTHPRDNIILLTYGRSSPFDSPAAIWRLWLKIPYLASEIARSNPLRAYHRSMLSRSAGSYTNHPLARAVGSRGRLTRHA